MKENGVITAWPILPFRKMTAYDINLIYEIKEEFDKKGNWVRQKKMQNGTVVEVKVREYKYY